VVVFARMLANFDNRGKDDVVRIYSKMGAVFGSRRIGAAVARFAHRGAGAIADRTEQKDRGGFL